VPHAVCQLGQPVSHIGFSGIKLEHACDELKRQVSEEVMLLAVAAVDGLQMRLPAVLICTPERRLVHRLRLHLRGTARLREAPEAGCQPSSSAHRNVASFTACTSEGRQDSKRVRCSSIQEVEGIWAVPETEKPQSWQNPASQPAHS
jgi:hypothetical protein